jgi:nucleoside-triphosphatase
MKTVELLKSEGVIVGGMISREVRGCSGRVGFEIVDLTNSKHGWLAHVSGKTGPSVGKYHVCLGDLDSIGAVSISAAVEKCQAIAIDEIGPMELFSELFKTAVKQALESTKPVLAVVHAKATNPLISVAKGRVDAEVFTVTTANRDVLPRELVQATVCALKY